MFPVYINQMLDQISVTFLNFFQHRNCNLIICHVFNFKKKFQALKAGSVSVQLLLDFFSESGPKAAGAELQVLRSERMMFAEKLDDVRHQCLHLQGELQSQVCVIQ